MFGSPITYRDSFFEVSGVESYYDFKPEKIKEGDIVIERENVHLLLVPDIDIKRTYNANDLISFLEPGQGKAKLLSSSGLTKIAIPKKQQPAQERQKDLAGTIVTQLIRTLQKDPSFKYKDLLSYDVIFKEHYIAVLSEDQWQNIPTNC